MEYFKINSLWKREGWYFDEKKKKDPKCQKDWQSFIEGDYAALEFGNIKYWLVDEKIDGTNIRICWERESDEYPYKLEFKGRTSKAVIPAYLLDRLKVIFNEEKLIEAFPSVNKVILYGEGYGPKIQKIGANYRDDCGFILFDIYVNHWWLKRKDVRLIGESIDLDVVPEIGIMTEKEIVDYVKSKPLSLCSKTPQVMEGVVCRSDPLMLFRNGKPIIFKLKCKEF